jgi:hypothetical protein
MQKRSGRTFRFARSLVASVLFVLVGCPGSLANPERFFVDAGLEAGPIVTPVEDAAPQDATSDAEEGCPADVVTGLFAPRCATAPCHSSIGQNGGLDLQGADLATRLLGKPSSQMPSFLIIDPSSAENSLLYTKLGPAPPFGNRMPLGVSPLSETQQACVLAWIKSVIAANPLPDAAADAPTD